MSQMERVRVRGAGLSLQNGDADSFLRVFTGKLSGERQSSNVAIFFGSGGGGSSASNHVGHP